MKKKIVYALVIALGICTTGCGNNSAAENLQENAKLINEDTSNDVAKDINGSEETEEIVEDSEKIDLEEEEVDEDWKQAYIPIVKQWEVEHSNGYSCYELIYIDDNDVPELVLACDDETGTGYDIYTCIDGEAVQLKFENDDKEQRGSNIVSPSGFPGKRDSYIEKTGIYMQGYRMRDCYVTEGCTLEGNILKDAFSYFYDDTSWDGSAAEPYRYTIEYINEKGEKITNEVVTDGDEKYYDIAGVPETAQIENIYNCDFEKCKSINCTMNYKTICSMLGMIDDNTELSYKEIFAKLLYAYMKDNTKDIQEGFGGFSYMNYGGKFMLKDINNDGIDEMLLTVMNEEYNIFIPADTWEESYVGNITAYSDDGIFEREYGETFTNYYSYYRLEDGELKCFDSFCRYDNPDYGDDIITEYTHVDSTGNESVITEAEFNAGDGLYGVHDVEGEWYDISVENINRILLQQNNEVVSTQTDETQYVTTAANDGGVNMRSGPGTEYDKVVEMIPNGEKLAVMDNAYSTTGKSWYKVEYRGMEGWVSASQVK